MGAYSGFEDNTEDLFHWNMKSHLTRLTAQSYPLPSYSYRWHACLWGLSGKEKNVSLPFHWFPDGLWVSLTYTSYLTVSPHQKFKKEELGRVLRFWYTPVPIGSTHPSPNSPHAFSLINLLYPAPLPGFQEQCNLKSTVPWVQNCSCFVVAAWSEAVAR